MNNNILLVNDDIDIEKTDYDPDLFLDGTESEEDISIVLKARKQYGLEDDDKYRKFIDDINSNPDFLKEEGEEENDIQNNSLPLVPSKQTELVETEVIEDKESINNNEKNNAKEKILKDADLQKFKNKIKIYNNHQAESFKIQLDNQRTYEKDIGKQLSKERARDDVANFENEKYKKLEENSKNLIFKINDDKGICFYKSKKTYYYRVNASMDFDNGSKNDANDYITDATGKPTKIVSTKEVINKEIVTNDKIHTYILDYHIPVIEKEVFNPTETEFFEKDGYLFKNLFKHTKYLKKRLQVKEGH